ncbi:unnamed protein product [Schistocephalus solidus]|uniref:WD_REPEATS_REGION domain-containing protein n=1 Tax=Schistocephalus solidus TaxID=70667 RepID=A0A183SPZ1_SCHSO|nr:unnamed protein product [Schistocephalus solidus]
MVYGLVQQKNHSFAFEQARVIGRANDKMARLLLESGFSTGTLNRAIDLHPAYQAIRTRLESVLAGPMQHSNKITRDRQLTPEKKKRGNGWRPRDQRGTLPHHHAHGAEINSRGHYRLISPLADEGQATTHADLPTNTTTAKELKVTGLQRSSLINNEQAGQNNKRPPNDRQSRSVLTLTGHTVRYTLIRAKFSPAHSTGQRFAYSGSAWGDWHIWDLCTGKMVSRNFVKAVTLRDVHWHPWDTRVVTSGLNGSLTCWGYRQNQAKRKPLLFTRRTSANVTPPIITDAVGGPRTDTDDGELCGQDEDEVESMDEQSRYYQSESGRLNYRVCLNRAGFSYRFPRRRPVPAVSYTEVVSDVSSTTTTTTSSDEEDEEGEQVSTASRHRHPRRTLSSSRGAATYLEDVSFYESEDEDSEDDPDFYPYDWTVDSPEHDLYGGRDVDGGLDGDDERFLPTPLHAFYARYLESGPVDGDPPRTRSQSRRLASATSGGGRSQPRGRGTPRSNQRHRSQNNPR